jgi:predicted amidohydrolase YtcJ
MDLPGATLLPALVEEHSHILLRAYSEMSWNDQVAHEGLALRAALEAHSRS